MCLGRKLWSVMLTCQDNEAALKQVYKHSTTESAVEAVTDCSLFKPQFISQTLVKILHL